jgi:hypothetical protein
MHGKTTIKTIKTLVTFYLWTSSTLMHSKSVKKSCKEKDNNNRCRVHPVKNNKPISQMSHVHEPARGSAVGTVTITDYTMGWTVWGLNHGGERNFSLLKMPRPNLEPTLPPNQCVLLGVKWPGC